VTGDLLEALHVDADQRMTADVLDQVGRLLARPPLDAVIQSQADVERLTDAFFRGNTISSLRSPGPSARLLRPRAVTGNGS